MWVWLGNATAPSARPSVILCRVGVPGQPLNFAEAPLFKDFNDCVQSLDLSFGEDGSSQWWAGSLSAEQAEMFRWWDVCPDRVVRLEMEAQAAGAAAAATATATPTAAATAVTPPPP